VQYASPQLGGAATTPIVQRSLEQLVEDAAATQVPPVTTARDAAAAVRVVPWHRALRTARTETARYLTVRLDRLRAGSADVDVLLTRDPAVQRAREAARTSLTAAGSHPDEVQAALGPP
jgi:hypothetical protein